MKLGIIGAGALGSALGERFVAAGHEVMFAARESAPETAAGLGAQAGSNSEAAAFGDVVILAVPFGALDAALAEPEAFRGRVVWSCVNALKSDMSGLAVGFDNSAAEEVARRIPGSGVVAAIPPFAAELALPPLHYEQGLAPSVFVCGDDAAAKELVDELVRDLGAEPVDAGPLHNARLVEPAMMLAVSIAYGGAERRKVGLRLLER